MKKPPHTTIRFKQLWARKYIPADVRSSFKNETLFLEKVGRWPMAYSEANAIVAAKVAEWDRQVDLVRNKPVIHTYRLDTDNVSGFLDTFPKELPPRFISVSNKPKAIAPGQDTTFLYHVDSWREKTHLRGKNLDSSVSDVRQFGAAVTETLENLSGRHVQVWCETMLKTVSTVTVRRKLSALRSYWEWLQVHEIVAADRKPFHGRKIVDRRSTVQKVLDQRQRFEPMEIPHLIKAAKDDWPLQALIKLAAYTGARREGVASLTTKSIVTVDGIACLSLAEKSAAGVRAIPIHPEISDLISNLVKKSTDGFLIPSEADKYGRRGDRLGKRFTKLKAMLGFDAKYVFHSIRHTVAYLCRKAGCPVEIRNQILGHEDGDAGAGSGYGGHIDMAHKLEWLERAIKY